MAAPEFTDWQARLDGLVEAAQRDGLSGPARMALHQAAIHLGESERKSAGKWDGPMRFGLVGESPAMLKVFDLIERVAASDISVLVTGPTGSGKELVARALHDQSPRAKKDFMAENCAAVPAGLLESELFGHVKGAFTGAVANRPGHFVAADGGTVFLDELGDMPLDMQAKLLRVLETREVRPVGANKSIKVDVRLIAATHRDLQSASDAGRFRSDLYYRLNVIAIELPALSERPEDIPHLARFFLQQAQVAMGKQADLTEASLAALQGYAWPGNVRQLSNVIQRALALCDGTIEPGDLGLDQH